MENETKNLYYDLNSILEFILGNDENHKDCETTEVYGMDNKTKKMVLMNKQVNETQKNNNDSLCAIRYDLVKNMMSLISDVGNETNVGVGLQIILNTFASYGFIKNVE